MKAETLALLKAIQVDELTDQLVYAALARRCQGDNAAVLERMARDEGHHAQTWAGYTGVRPKPARWKVYFYILLFRIFGLTFVVNLLESGEDKASERYASLLDEVPEAKQIMEDETRHEQELVAMIEEEKLQYIGSMVLGLNDALVELTGALAGFTLALGSNRAVGLAGFITGVAATLSMAASEYLSKKSDSSEKHPLKAALYTGFAYMVTVALLLMPYALLDSPLAALACCLLCAACIIFLFTFFVSVVRREAFAPKFFEMLGISFAVAGISFLIGWLAKSWLGIEL